MKDTIEEAKTCSFGSYLLIMILVFNIDAAVLIYGHRFFIGTELFTLNVGIYTSIILYNRDAPLAKLGLGRWQLTLTL